ncbi:unnamed protein product [Eruca vesicaria subsp. sativa]|uniref:Peptidyl-prolyl cis-trans isomerase n=1 Tax=Eruca vesicaria subsp. sativa TaxID=29727 RepID=A0ABC8K794_ERUVS|nr:unnamed protein product [Eruca vesicaria subsp. sativa]
MANNPRVFLDIAVSSTTVGRIVIELFADTNPKTAENFRALCTGEKGIGESGIPLHYKGSIIHGIVPDDIWCGGDITKGDGSGGEPIYGNQVPAEDCIRKHDRPGILTTAYSVRNPNRSQFVLLMKEFPDYDGQHIVFGQVVDGFDVIALVEKMVGNEFVIPSDPVTIADCGQILLDSEKSGASVSTMVGYSALNSDSTAAVIYQKLLNQLRDAQLKIGAMEAAMAKQTVAYQSGYGGDIALAALVMEHLVHSRGSTFKRKRTNE